MIFYDSTLLRHDRSLYSGTNRESRLVNMGMLTTASKWVAEKRIEAGAAWAWMEPFRKVADVVFKPVTWPIGKGVHYTRTALHHVLQGAEWSYHTAMEAGKGALQTTARPLVDLAYSRTVPLLRGYFWELPKATLSAAWKLPIAFGKFPFQIASGVREGIFGNSKTGNPGILGNVKEIFDSVKNLKFIETAKNTRKLLTDAFFPTFDRPLRPIWAPIAAIGMAVWGAEVTPPYEAIKTSVQSTIPQGFSRFMNAPQTASSIMAENNLKAEAIKAELQKKKEEERAAFAEAVAEAQGKTVVKEKGGGGGKKA